MTRGKDPMYMYYLYKPDISLRGVKFKVFKVFLHLSLTSVHIALFLHFILHTHRTHRIYLCKNM